MNAGAVTKPGGELKLLLAEDHSLVRAGLRALIEGFGLARIVAEASDGREAVRLARMERPDLVVMDIAMPELNGLEATAQIRQRLPDVGIIILSMHSSEEYVLQALRAGATGYLLKDSAASELRLAIEAVARGDSYLSPAISRTVVERIASGAEPAGHPLDRLTARQREVLQCIVEGKSTRETAAALHLSVKTVEAHRAQLMSRLEIYDVPGLVRYAIRVGLISSER